MDRHEGDPYRRGASEPLEHGADWGFPRSDIVAELGRQAAEGAPFDQLMAKACQATAELLDADYVDVFQLRPGRGDLVFREGVGWPSTDPDETTMDASPRSQTGFTVRSWKPTVVHDIREEARFEPSSVMDALGIVSGVTVVIPAPVEPWGVFGVHSTEPRSFDEDATTFIQAMGQVLSRPIRSERTRTEIERERERFESLVQEVDEYAIFTCDPDGRVETWNKGAERIKGYAEEEVVGEHLAVFYTEEDRQAGVPEENLRAAAEQGSVEDEGWRVRRDGSLFWANVSLTAFHDDAGRLRGFAKVTKDMTERRERERRVQLSRRTIIDNFPNGAVALVDEDLRFQLVGGDPMIDFDRPLTQLEGMDVRDAIPGPVGEEVATRFADALAGESSSFEHETDDGRCYRVRIVPVRDETGDVFAALGFSQDVTEEKQREQELAASNERLEQFAYAASHDLQEPLRMVSSYLQLVERRSGDELDEESREFLAHAVDGAQRMRRMIKSLLRYSRVTSQGQPPHPVDADAVFRDAVGDLQLQIEETDAEITVDELPTVEADPDQLAQVFRNLLSNALQYSGDAPPRVHVEAERIGDEWRFSVRDEGIGIAPEHTEEVFEVFKRLGDRGAGESVGIGLAVCEKIVERHDGGMWVDSEPGEGSTFRFTMPAADRDGGSSSVRSRPSP